jgi:PhnB protein
MPQHNAYLNFDGTCAEAMKFYQSVLGGKLDVMTIGQSPAAEHVPAEAHGRVMHANLVFDGGTLMAADSQPGMPFNGMHGFGLVLTYPTAAEAKKTFDKLVEGGRVTMPFDKTFWAEGFGMLVDRYGTPWMLNGAMTAM